MKLGWFSREYVKESMFSYFFKGCSIISMQKKVMRYTQNRLPLIIKKSAFERISYHKKRGDLVYVVSASLDLWLKAWVESQDINLICTEIEVDEMGCINGKFTTPNCYGIEKVNRIKTKVALSQFETVYAYGNSKGDNEMLELAGEKFYQNFK